MDWKQRIPAAVLVTRLPRGRIGLVAARAATWLYLVVVLAVWLLLRFAGERWWPATMMLFGPRWPYAAPLAVLVPVAAFLRPRLLWPLALSALIVLGPILGFRLPWGRLVAPEGPPLRVLTYNVHGQSVTSEAMRDLIARVGPDIVALQEASSEADYDWPDGWNVRRSGQFIVASPFPVREVRHLEILHPGNVWPTKVLLECLVETSEGDVPFGCVHLSTPRFGIMAVLDRSTVLAPSRSGAIVEDTQKRRREAELLVEFLKASPATLIVAGDFNTPVDSVLYRRAWGRYRNAFCSSGMGVGHTMRPEVRGLQFGARIDHILMRSDWWPRRCWVGPDMGSDHLPVVADLVRVPPTGRP
ncbi:MAG TPA: hypothetical protein DD670_03485 [Planctomycetaceae bacterium]|nr:hypothetical protein [Planctomycetaceae bacterium]